MPVRKRNVISNTTTYHGSTGGWGRAHLTPKEYYDIAKDQLKSRLYEHAAGNFGDMIRVSNGKLAPEFMDAWYLRGKSHLDYAKLYHNNGYKVKANQYFIKALKAFEEASEVLPKDGRVWNEIGYCQYIC